MADGHDLTLPYEFPQLAQNSRVRDNDDDILECVVDGVKVNIEKEKELRAYWSRCEVSGETITGGGLRDY